MFQEVLRNLGYNLRLVHGYDTHEIMIIKLLKRRDMPKIQSTPWSR